MLLACILAVAWPADEASELRKRPAQGTLGLVTGVAVQCPPRSSSVQVAFLAVPSFGKAQQVRVLPHALPVRHPSALCLPGLHLACCCACAAAAGHPSAAHRQDTRHAPAAGSRLIWRLQLLRMAKASLGEILSAFEFLDQQALDLTLQHLPDADDPLPDRRGQIYVLLETSGSRAEHDVAKLEVRGAAAVCRPCSVCLPCRPSRHLAAQYAARRRRAHALRARLLPPAALKQRVHAQAFVAQAQAAELTSGHRVARDPAEAKHIWSMRTGISVALRNAGAAAGPALPIWPGRSSTDPGAGCAGPVYKYDFSLAGAAPCRRSRWQSCMRAPSKPHTGAAAACRQAPRRSARDLRAGGGHPPPAGRPASHRGRVRPPGCAAC